MVATSSPVLSVLPAQIPSPSTLPRESDDPVPSSVRDLLAVFHEALQAVRFPDIDVSVLDEAALAVELQYAEVLRVQALLDDARRALDDAQEHLFARAQRGLAYARVYADGDAALGARLDAVALSRTRTARTTSSNVPSEAPRRRTRRTNADVSLFSPGENADDALAVAAE